MSKEFITKIEDLSVKEVNNRLNFVNKVYYQFGEELDLEEIKWLFWAIEVKDIKGKWHELKYGNNYTVTFDHSNIYIDIWDGLYDEKNKKIHFYSNRMYIRRWFPEKSDVGTHIKFPKYTGYDKFLNGEAEDLMPDKEN